jgi:hypothetical protein
MVAIDYINQREIRTMNAAFLRVALPNGLKRIAMGLVFAVAGTFLHQNATAASIDLGTASDFAILGGSAVTFDPPMTTVTGDVGVSPGTSITGAAANLTLTGSSTINNGAAAQAQLDSAIAYGVAAGATPTTDYGAGENQLGGKTLGPGVYRFGHGTTANLIGVLTLDGQNDPNSVWIFQATSDLVTASGSLVSMINAANPCNVFWQVSSSATLKSGSVFDGTILAYAAITLDAGVTVDGRLLAQTELVSLIGDTINNNNCTASANGLPDTGSTLLLLGSGLATLLAFRRRFFCPV